MKRSGDWRNKPQGNKQRKTQFNNCAPDASMINVEIKGEDGRGERRITMMAKEQDHEWRDKPMASSDTHEEQKNTSAM
ncbi:hypothetical protein E2C01_061686 [Portunus trituberculatus]|uniref:Uncharacterized protein n=1 Tax=Portunus trituberculatus TaxID=210409 RepID=A0A5B7HCJ0_PORTR|nr:hypothetical protein [Portunus trituberculatus]